MHGKASNLWQSLDRLVHFELNDYVAHNVAEAHVDVMNAHDYEKDLKGAVRIDIEEPVSIKQRFKVLQEAFESKCLMVRDAFSGVVTSSDESME